MEFDAFPNQSLYSKSTDQDSYNISQKSSSTSTSPTFISTEPKSNLLFKTYPLTKEDFIFDENDLIGKGTYSYVYKARYKFTNDLYCIKMINKENIFNNKMKNNLNNEIKIMYEINHEHIIKLLSYFEDSNYIYLVLPYCDKGNLDTVLKTKLIDNRTKLRYIYCIIDAVAYLHQKKIMHRDIKPENILIDKNDRVFLSDFGIATYINNNRKTFCGSDDYMAPEIIQGKEYNEKVDIWSLGILIYELLSGKVPFERETFTNDVLNNNKIKVNYQDDFSPKAKNLLGKMLKVDQKKRIGINEIRRHCLFKDIKMNENGRKMNIKMYKHKRDNKKKKILNTKK